MFIDRLARATRPCSKDKLCAEEKALGELDKPSQDPGATSDLSCIPFKCQVCSCDVAPGARRHRVRQEHLHPCFYERGRMSPGRRCLCFFGALLGCAWNLLMRLMKKLSGMEWMETQIWFLVLTY